MITTDLSQSEKELIARASIPADNVDLSMFSEELQSELIREAISILCEEAKNRYHAESAKKAVEFYKRINDPHKWIAKIDLEALIREDNSDEVSEVVLAGLGRNDELKERATGYLFGENCKGHSSADIKNTLRALEYATGSKPTNDDIRKLSQDVLVSKHPFAIRNWICGYGLLNEKPEIPKDKLDKVLHTCNHGIFRNTKESSGRDLLKRIAKENQDKLIELGDIAFGNKDFDSAALLYLTHFGSKKDAQGKSKLQEINKIYVDNGARPGLVRYICGLTGDEVPYLTLYNNFKQASFGKESQHIWFDRNAYEIISVLLQAPKDLLENLVKQEDTHLLEANSSRSEPETNFLYKFVIHAYSKLGNQDAAKSLIDRGLAVGAININNLDNFDIEYAKIKAAEIKQKRQKEREEKTKPKEEPKNHFELQELVIDAAKDVKAAYKSAGFEGVAEFISELAKKYNVPLGLQADAVNIYHHILEKTEKRKFDNDVDGTVFIDEEAEAAVKYCLLNNVRWGIPSRLISKYSEEKKNLHKKIDPKIWLQAAALVLLSEVNSSRFEEAIRFTECAGVKPSKMLYTQLGFQRLSYAASQRTGNEGKWIFDTTDMWSAREAFKKGDHPELVDFINKNYSSFFKE